MISQAELTAKQLKLIANPCRLVVLCALVEGRKSVSELMAVTGTPQTLMSNHLSVLRKAGVIDFERDHRVLNYFLKDERMRQVLHTLHAVYCSNDSL